MWSQRLSNYHLQHDHVGAAMGIPGSPAMVPGQGNGGGSGHTWIIRARNLRRSPSGERELPSRHQTSPWDGVKVRLGAGPSSAVVCPIQPVQAQPEVLALTLLTTQQPKCHLSAREKCPRKGTSLAVQCLGLRLQVQSLVGEIRSHTLLFSC